VAKLEELLTLIGKLVEASSQQGSTSISGNNGVREKNDRGTQTSCAGSASRHISREYKSPVVGDVQKGSGVPAGQDVTQRKGN
jgi:hypothetical protein